ncbi:MOS4-associated complex 3A [Pelomyxa schiedti]|nr:MOS4-associated complex 3A [Pelomyxa schiedti]
MIVTASATSGTNFTPSTVVQVATSAQQQQQLLEKPSGAVTDVVVSRKSGHMFERAYIERYIDVHGKCPITNEPLEKTDLITLQTCAIVKPRSSTAVNIPGLLSNFQTEWDAITLECATLRTTLNQVISETAEYLSMHDASCKLIAELTQERDSTLRKLEEIQAQKRKAKIKAKVAAAAQQGEPKTLPDEVKKLIKEKSVEISQQRKKRRVSESLAPAMLVSRFGLLGSHPTHKASQPGITCVDVHPTLPNLIVTGGVDADVILFDNVSKTCLSTLSGHSKQVSQVAFHPRENVIFSTSYDKTARVWTCVDEDTHVYNSKLLMGHSGKIVGGSLHCSGKFFVTASLDNTWRMFDVETTTCLGQNKNPPMNLSFMCVQFHPDGLLIGTGMEDKVVRIWDMNTQQPVACFEGHTGRVLDLCFSENGYTLASGSDDQTVKLWDLRKQLNFETFNIGAPVNAVRFDYSGIYLAAGSSSIDVFRKGKTFDKVGKFTEHTGAVTDVAFGPDARFLASTSRDRTLKIYGA